MPPRHTLYNNAPLEFTEGAPLVCLGDVRRAAAIHKAFKDHDNAIETRVIDGRDMDREASLMRILNSVLGLPEYFGHNWDALDECLADREFEPRVPTVLVIHHAEGVLRQGSIAQRRIFAEIVNGISGGKSASNYANMPVAYPALWLVMAFSNQAGMDDFLAMAPDAVVCNDETGSV